MSIFPTKILLATDGSEEAKLALRTAVDLANSTGSELHVVIVAREYHPASYEFPEPSELRERASDARTGGPRDTRRAGEEDRGGWGYCNGSLPQDGRKK